MTFVHWLITVDIQDKSWSVTILGFSAEFAGETGLCLVPVVGPFMSMYASRRTFIVNKLRTNFDYRLVGILGRACCSSGTASLMSVEVVVTIVFILQCPRTGNPHYMYCWLGTFPRPPPLLPCSLPFFCLCEPRGNELCGYNADPCVCLREHFCRFWFCMLTVLNEPDLTWSHKVRDTGIHW